MSIWSKLLRQQSTSGKPQLPAAYRTAVPSKNTVSSQPMNLIQVPDLTRKLVTRYGIREKAPAPTLSTEVVPVVLVDDLIGESDLIRPRIRPAFGQLQQVGAAQTILFGLLNPANSRVVIHLYYFIVSSSATAQWDVHFTGTPGSGVAGTTAFRNGLLPGQTPVGQVAGHLTGVSPGGAIGMKVRSAATAGVFPLDAVIDENQAIQLRSQLVYTGTAEVSLVWTEEDKV